MIGSLIDQDDVVLIAEFAPQVGRGNHSAAATAQDDDLFSPIRHLNIW